MLGIGLQLEEIDDVHEPKLQIGNPIAKNRGGGERLHRRDVAAAGQDHIGLLAGIGTGPGPDADAFRAMCHRIVNRHELKMFLLVGDDDVDGVGRAEAVIGDDEQGVRIGRQIDANDRRSLVGDEIDEAGILVREPIVVLPPDGGREKDILRGDRRAPAHVILRDVEPLRVLIEHRIDDVRERFIRVKEPVSCR